MNFDAAADELYAADPADFIPTRTRLAAGLPADDAKRLSAMRRPTLSAWAVNLLSRDDDAEPIFDLGARMREAWSSGGDIGDLERERGKLVTALVRRARALVKEAGRQLSDSAAREVENTLEAVIADPDAAGAVRAGRLDRPVSHAGFGPLGTTATPVRAKPRKVAEDPRLKERRLEEEARRAKEAAAEAARALGEWQTELDETERRLATATERRDELRAELAEAEQQHATIAREVQVTRRERDRAQRTADAARRKLRDT